MPIVNGHQAETGCYAEGHRGWYAGQRVIELAQGFGWELDAEGQEAVDLYYGTEDYASEGRDIAEIVIGQGGIVDEAEHWLNSVTSSENEDGDQPGYLWHWHDGEFFLSPICDDPEVCDDDTCAHWD